MNTDTHLNDVALAQLVWKPGIVRNLARQIVTRLLAQDSLWPDELKHDDLSEGDRHCVGVAFKLLIKFDVIQQTGQYRRSFSENRNGGVVFQYRLADAAKARTFLARNHATIERPVQQALPIEQELLPAPSAPYPR